MSKLVKNNTPIVIKASFGVLVSRHNEEDDFT